MLSSFLKNSYRHFRKGNLILKRSVEADKDLQFTSSNLLLIFAFSLRSFVLESSCARSNVALFHMDRSNCSPWLEETLTLPGELGGHQATGRQHLQAPLLLVTLPTGLREPSGRLPPGPGQIAYTPLPHKPVFPTLSQCTFIEQLHVIPRKADHGQRTVLRCDLGDRPRTSLLLSALSGDWGK